MFWKLPQTKEAKKTSVIIVRESDTTGGCICCSGGGLGEFGKHDPSYGEIRSIAEECGRLHREITERFGNDGVEIIQIEPRAYFYLMPKVLLDVLRFNRSIVSAIRTLFLWFPVPAVIVNGKPVSTGKVPTLNEIEAVLKPDWSAN